MFRKIILTLPIIASVAFAQKKAPDNWFNLDHTKDGIWGVSTEEAYNTVLKGKTATPIVVAVIDGGVDYLHEDLKDVMWVNPKEIAGNGKDDDNNGYIDDIYGWNFIGGRDGNNVNYDNLELTRVYRDYKRKFTGINAASLKGADKEEYDRYQALKVKFEEERTQAQRGEMQMKFMQTMITNVKRENGGVFSKKALKKYKPANEAETKIRKRLKMVFMAGTKPEEFEDQIKQGLEHYVASAQYQLNPDYDARTIVGDNYSDPNQRNYGNADIKGPDAGHGSHVAGIIAATRTNDIGMKGVATNVRIMGVRCVPNGDERDKDVANSIRYAVDNGARVINMSFGKQLSYDKKTVDEAVKYAESKDVFLVHAAGNDNVNIDSTIFYPNPNYEGGGVAKNWITVGASSWRVGKNGVGDFSNYSAKSVDVFAPGVDIYSTTPESKYDSFNGTSMAAPVVAGVAALIRSYYPTLTAPQVREILMESVEKPAEMLIKPGADKKADLVSWSNLCVTGGIVNAKKALELAAKKAK